MYIYRRTRCVASASSAPTKKRNTYTYSTKGSELLGCVSRWQTRIERSFTRTAAAKSRTAAASSPTSSRLCLLPASWYFKTNINKITVITKKKGIEPDSVGQHPASCRPGGSQKQITRFTRAKAQILTPEEQELELERRDLFFEYASVYEVNPLIRSLRSVLVQKYTC